MNRASQETLDRALAVYVDGWENVDSAAKIDEAKRLLAALRSNTMNPQATLMFATVRRIEPVLHVGEVALIEVPNNCTIHSLDAQRLLRIVDLANLIGQHWRDQEGVSALFLEEMASITAPPAGDND